MSLPTYITNIAPEYGEKSEIMAQVCPECPWRKEDKVGEYAPASGAGIFNIVEKHVEMACHMSQKTQFMDEGSKVRRCMGIERFRANIGVDSEVKPDFKTVFANREEALNAWPAPDLSNLARTKHEFFRKYPDGHWIDQNRESWVAGERAPWHDAGCDKCGVF